MAKNDLATKRETGAEKATSTCPNCGGEVPAVTTAYGSTAPGACPQCWPETAEGTSTQLAAQEKAAEAAPEPQEAPQG